MLLPHGRRRACHCKGTKTNVKPCRIESFLIDTGIGEASIWGVAQDL